MTIKGIPGIRFAGVPALVLLAVVRVLQKRRRIKRSTLFAHVSTSLGRFARYANDGMLQKALEYLLWDHAIETSGDVITITKRWPKGKAVSWALSHQTEIEASVRGRRVARKATKTGGRKKSSKPSVTSRRPKPTATKNQETISKKSLPRTYRNSENERYRVPVFYGTDRERDNQGNFTNSGVPSGKLDRGLAIVTFPKRRQTGSLNEPPFGIESIRTILPKAFSEIQEIQPLAKAQFHTQMRTALRQHQDALFLFVHGFNVSFEAAIKRAAQIALDTNFQGCAVAYSWPSRAHWACYDADDERIDAAADVLSAYIAEIRTQHPSTTVHLIAHSMGARISALALQRLQGGVSIDEIVLQAPDISTIDYPRLATALSSRGRRVTVYASKGDRALGASAAKRLAAGIHRVGQDVQHAIHSLVDAIDATQFGADGLFGHSYAFKKPLLLDLRDTLDGIRQLRAQLELVPNNGNPYYKFRP